MLVVALTDVSQFGPELFHCRIKRLQMKNDLQTVVVGRIQNGWYRLVSEVGIAPPAEHDHPNARSFNLLHVGVDDSRIAVAVAPQLRIKIRRQVIAA